MSLSTLHRHTRCWAVWIPVGKNPGYWSVFSWIQSYVLYMCTFMYVCATHTCRWATWSHKAQGTRLKGWANASTPHRCKIIPCPTLLPVSRPVATMAAMARMATMEHPWHPPVSSQKTPLHFSACFVWHLFHIRSIAFSCLC